jgi:suppressor of fused
MSLSSKLNAVYGDQEPLRLPGSPGSFFSPPSPDVLVYRANSPEHWHFVSDGIRETYEEPDEGAELSMRVPRAAGENEPPEWASDFFTKVATHFLNSSAPFEVGHHLEVRGALDGLPFALGAADPSLDSESGVRVVQLYGLTEDELDAIMSWDSWKFTELLAARDPLLVTKLNRRSILTDAAAREQIERGTRDDGCSMDSAYTSCVEWERDLERAHLRVRLDQAVVPSLVRMLKGRTAHGRSFHLSSFEGPDQRVTFESADASSWAIRDGIPYVSLTPELGLRMARELPKLGGGSHNWPELASLTLEIKGESEAEEGDDEEDDAEEPDESGDPPN